MKHDPLFMFSKFFSMSLTSSGMDAACAVEKCDKMRAHAIGSSCNQHWDEPLSPAVSRKMRDVSAEPEFCIHMGNVVMAAADAEAILKRRRKPSAK